MKALKIWEYRDEYKDEYKIKVYNLLEARNKVCYFLTSSYKTKLLCVNFVVLF